MACDAKQAQMAIWVGKLETNMEKFIDQNVTDPEQQLEFIRNQYVMFDAAHKVLAGKAHFVGACGELR